jgi:hypothetical protein
MLLITINSVSAQSKTNVLVLGTIHQLHERDTNYTYYDIIKILDNFKPDVICVEIREQEFRKRALDWLEKTLPLIPTFNFLPTHLIDFNPISGINFPEFGRISLFMPILPDLIP